ncbi:MAG TPA: MFS transporter [Candidatus Didemnitutus sp.]|nr:MFS transporter [Candidatus Didemnitutus sp.]
MKADSDKLRLSEKLGYGCGDLASCLFWTTFSTFLLYFYTDVFGISAAAAGTMFLVTRTWDLFVDPVIGAVADRTTTRWGKFRPYLLWIPIPLGIVAILTFTTPGYSPSGKLAYAYVTYGLLMMLYSAVNVPYAALMGVMTPHPEQRTALSSYRMMGAFVGNLLIQYSVYSLAFYFSVPGSKLAQVANLTVQTVINAFTGAGDVIQKNVITPIGFQHTMTVVSIAALVFFGLTFWLTRERVVPVVQQSVKKDVADLLRNAPWLVLVAATIATNCFSGVRNNIVIYYFKYFVHNEALSASYLVVGSLVSIAGIYSIQYITPRWGKKVPFILCMGISSVLSVMSYFVGPKDFVAMFVYQILINLLMGPPAALLWSFYADACDHSEIKTGRRATGLIFSASGMCQKLGWTIAGFAAGKLLEYYHFQANVDQPVETLHGIRLMLSIIPGLCSALAALLMLLYPLNAKVVQDNEAILRARRESAENAAPVPA